MRRIAIVGAGQAGLILGIGLVDAGYKVTLFTDRTSESVLNGKLIATLMIFEDALQIQDDLKLNLWDDEFPDVERFRCQLCDPQGNPALVISNKLELRLQGIDPRLKFSAWMDEFEKRGGELVIGTLTLEDIEKYTQNYDLVVVAVGKGSLATIFERDAQRSTYEKPARYIGGVLVTGLKRNESDLLTHEMLAIPHVGEIGITPFYSKDKGRSDIVIFEAYPGSAMDRFRQVQSGEELLSIGKKFFQESIPWSYEAVKDVELNDEQAWLCGAITPVVRKPVGHLPNGSIVMGIGDVVILNDPLAAQGGNNAAKMAHLITQRIIEHGNRRFDGEWMQAVFDEFWKYSQYANALADCLLMPPSHLIGLMVAAAQNADVARDYFQGFNHPPSLSPWFFEPEETKKYLERKGMVKSNWGVRS